ncbi:hypothetical protein [Georgenia sp. SUBG003]|uniref:hypothetical protein n=1 Tax=Georgenia sp. SUBG003 TaxID=1497974 RepID=UPI003AB142D2
MSEAPRCYPGDGGTSAMRADILAAIGQLAEAQAQLRAAFPAQWTGAGANTFTDVLLSLLHHSQAVDRALRAADRAALVADAELEARLAGGTA